jgi:hypothetical protein
MRVFQQRVVQQQPPLSQRSKSSPAPKRVQGWQGHYAAAAAAAAVLFACSVAAARADQQAAASYSFGTWSTAALSVARQWLAATSLPNLGVAIFAGGSSTCRQVCIVSCCQCVARVVVIPYRMLEWAELCLLIACASLMPCAAGNSASNVVDVFNVTSGAWSTAALSVARILLAATSLPNVGVAIFAGGMRSTCTCSHVDFRIVSCCIVRVGEWDG